MYGLAAEKVRRSADGLTYAFLHPPAGQIPRRHAAHRPRRRLLAEYPQRERPPDHHAIAARFYRRQGERRLASSWRPLRRSAAATCRCSSPGLPIFSRAYYATKPFDESTLDVPLGSGAYKVGRFEAGRYIEYERVKDWWGADLPVARGQNNFDIVRFEYYRDRDVGFEGFTAENYLFREEFTSRTWATRYDFPADQGRPRQTRRACPTTRRPARKAGSSIRGGRSSPIRGCAKRSATPSISNGPTRRSCTAPTIAPSRCSRIPT